MDKFDKIIGTLSSLSTSSKSSPSFVPDREEIFILQRMRRHIRTRTSVKVHNEEFKVVTTSLTPTVLNPVRRAVFFLESLKNARKLCRALTLELDMIHKVLKGQGLLLDDDFPVELREFFSTDPAQVSVRGMPEVPTPYLVEDDLRVMITQLLGVLNYSDVQ